MTSAPSVSDLLDLRGKVALVTGGSAGVGRGIATRLSDAGAAVAVHYRGGQKEVEALASTLRGKGRKSLSVHSELRDSQSVERPIGTITDELGAIDILINNAARQTHAGFEEMSVEEWRAMMATNSGGAFIVTKAVVAGMTARGSGGAIVNIASIEGLQPAHPRTLRRLEGRPHNVHPRGRAAIWKAWNPRKRRVPWSHSTRPHRGGMARGRGSLDEGRASWAHGRG